jgi:tetratricopeptide (TPR) repeat protein
MSHVESLEPSPAWLSARDSVIEHANELFLSYRAGDPDVESGLIASLEEADRHDNALGVAHLVRLRAHLLRDRGRFQEALALAFQAADEFACLNEISDQVATLRLCAACYSNLSDMAACSQTLIKAGRIAEQHKLHGEAIEVLLAEGFCALEMQRDLGILDNLIAMGTQMFEYLQTDRRIVFLNNISSSLCQVGRFDEARDHAERGLELLGSSRDNVARAFLIGNLATASTVSANLDEVRELANRASEMFREIGKSVYGPTPLYEVGAAYAKLERYQEALMFLTEAKELCLSTDGSPRIQRIHELLSVVHERLGNHDLALAELRASARIKEEIHLRDVARIEELARA